MEASVTRNWESLDPEQEMELIRQRITIVPGLCGGRPTIRGTRIRAMDVLGMMAAGMTLLNAMYGLFVLPESLPRERRRSFAWRRANPVGSLTLLRSHSELLGLSTVTFMYYLAHQVFPSIFVLYAGYRYHWDTRDVGLTLASVGVANIIVQGGLVKVIVGVGSLGDW